MEELGVYVVRIYRQDQVDMDGVVEAVSSGEQMPFHDRDQLWRALHLLPTARRTRLSINSDEEGTT
jgi:hypothetical protein